MLWQGEDCQDISFAQGNPDLMNQNVIFEVKACTFSRNFIGVNVDYKGPGS